MITRQDYSEEELDAIFAKAAPIIGTVVLRKDVYGNIISRLAYGLVDNSFGWEVDHIKPISKGGDNNFSNLQPLYIKANRVKSDDSML